MLELPLSCCKRWVGNMVNGKIEPFIPDSNFQSPLSEDKDVKVYHFKVNDRDIAPDGIVTVGYDSKEGTLMMLYKLDDSTYGSVVVDYVIDQVLSTQIVQVS